MADAVDVLPVSRHTIRIFVKDIPSMGYKTLKVVPKYHTRAATPINMLCGINTMENEYLKVKINSNGTLKVTEKETGKEYDNIGYFKDTGENGSPWEHKTPEIDEEYTTINEQAIVSLVYSGEFETKYRIVLNWAIPENIVDGGKRRSSRLAPYRIEMLVTLRKGARWVEFETKINNNVPNHYLQVSFPTDIDTEFV